MSYRLGPNAVLDLAFRQTDVTEDVDFEVLFGITLNLGAGWD